MGADHVFDLDATTPAERLEELRARTHGEGVDVVIEAAGSARAFEEGLELVRDGGRYVIAGHYTDVGPSSVNAHRQINRKHLEIRGCWGSEPGHFLRALALLERHAADVPWREIGERDVPADRPERGAGRRRSDADHQGARRSMDDVIATRFCDALRAPADKPTPNPRTASREPRTASRFTHETHENRRDRRPGLQRARNAPRAARRRRRRLPAELLARDARVARAALRSRSATRPQATGRTVAVMQDLSGPKIRTGPLEGGQPVTLDAGADAANRGRRPARQQRTSSSRRTSR